MKRMKNSVSDQSFYIESEDEEDEEKVFNRHEGEDDGNESDASDSSVANQQQNKPSSYNTSWPQSYRSFLFYTLHNLLNQFFYAFFF